MKTAAIVGKKTAEIIELLEEKGFAVVKENPDMVVSYGGDGTLMRAEYAYPGIPKIILRSSSVCKLCLPIPNEEIIEHIAAGSFFIDEVFKLEAVEKGKKLTALNDIIIHNENPRYAIRYKVSRNGDEIGRSIIGDGIVIATPLGSTGYYRSITDSYFEVGIGLAFNNSTEQSDHIVLKEDSTVTFVLERGPAVVYADNQDELIVLEKNDSVEIKKSRDVARIVKI